MANLEHLDWLDKLSRTGLYDLLEKALVELIPIESLQKHAERYRQEAGEFQQKKKNIKPNYSFGCTYFLLWFLIIGLSIVCFGLFWTTHELSVLLLLPVVFMFFFMYLYYRRVQSNIPLKEQEIEQQAKNSEDKATDCEKDAQGKYGNAIYLPAIPEGYCYSLALETMLEILKNGKATTWKELAREYGEQCYRWKMQEDNRQRLELQMQQAEIAEETLQQVRSAKNWAAIGAIGSWR